MSGKMTVKNLLRVHQATGDSEPLDVRSHHSSSVKIVIKNNIIPIHHSVDPLTKYSKQMNNDTK